MTIESSLLGNVTGEVEITTGGESTITVSVLRHGGDWDATTALPVSPQTGDLYRVSVPGSNPAVSGSESLQVGDLIIYYSASWYLVRTYTEDRVDANSKVSTAYSHSQVTSGNPHGSTTDDISEGSTNLYYTESRVSANTDVDANTAARHSAVTLGTEQNGLSISGQEIDLALATDTTAGAMPADDKDKLDLIDTRGSTSGEVTVVAPSVVTSYTITLPPVQGAGTTTLYNDGAGNLSWQDLTVSARTYDSGPIVAGALTLPLTHGLPSTPTMIFLWREVSAGVWENLDAASYLDVTSTSLTGDLTPLYGDTIRVVACSAVAPDTGLQTQINNLTALVNNFEWQPSVLDYTGTPPGSPTQGDRYLVAPAATGDWSGQDNRVAEWDGAAWQYTTPTTGMFVAADDEPNLLYLYGGSAWSAKYFESTTASLGVKKVGFDIQLDPNSVPTASPNRTTDYLVFSDADDPAPGTAKRALISDVASRTLQEAYAAGNTVTTAAPNPLRVEGDAGVVVSTSNPSGVSLTTNQGIGVGDNAGSSGYLVHLFSNAARSGIYYRSQVDGQTSFAHASADNTNYLSLIPFNGGNRIDSLKALVFYAFQGFTVESGTATTRFSTNDIQSRGNNGTNHSTSLAGGYATATQTLTEARLALYGFGWNGSNGYSVGSAGFMRLRHLSTTTSGDSRLEFLTGPAAAIRMWLDGLTGRVVVGHTDSPTRRMEVRSGSETTLGLRNTSSSSSVLDLEGATSGAVSVGVPDAVTSYAVRLPSAQGAANTTLVNDGAGNLTWKQAAPEVVVQGSAGPISASHMQEIYVLATTYGATTVNLPASPAVGTRVRVVDAEDSSATNNISVVAAGTDPINSAGTPGQIDIDINGAAVEFVWIGGAIGWRAQPR